MKDFPKWFWITLWFISTFILYLANGRISTLENKIARLENQVISLGGRPGE